ncbi:MAG: hypothetical protein DMG25_20310, partial [Acidobacteria bacterium]
MLVIHARRRRQLYVQRQLQPATIKIVSSSSGSPTASQSVQLSGNGGSASTLAVSPTSLSFPDTPIRTSSAPQTVTITNTGSSPLNIFGFAAFNDYAQTNNCVPLGASSGSLAAGAKCTITVTFRPTMIGAINQLLQVVNDTPTPYISISLTGSGIAAPEVTLCPTSVSFGSQTVGTTSAAQVLTVSNTGSDNLTISAITASGDFTASNLCGSNIHADGRWGAHGKAHRDRLGERQPAYCGSRRNRRGALCRRAGVDSWHARGGRGTAPDRGDGRARSDEPRGRVGNTERRVAPVRREPLGGQSRDTHARTTSPEDAPDEVRSQPGTGGEARQLRIARAGVH